MDLVVDDKPIFAFTNGRAFDRAKPVILFVHGAGMDHSVWTLQARYFAHHGVNALGIDLPGHGRSEGPALTSIEDMGRLIGGVVRALSVERAALIGHSMGALVCLEAAAQYQDRVDGLALFGASPTMAVHPALLEAASADLPLAAELVSSWGHGKAGHIGGNQAPGGWMMGQALRLLERTPKGVLYSDLAACNQYQRGLTAAAAIRCSTLLITGSDDRMTPALQGAKLAAAISGACVVEIADVGHLMLAEDPDATLDALIAWHNERSVRIR